VLWVIPLAVALVGLVVLRGLARAVAGEITPTRTALDVFTRELHPALVRIHDETARARARLPRADS
jgi:hypothetical protein